MPLWAVQLLSPLEIVSLLYVMSNLHFCCESLYDGDAGGRTSVLSHIRVTWIHRDEPLSSDCTEGLKLTFSPPVTVARD